MLVGVKDSSKDHRIGEESHAQGAGVFEYAVGDWTFLPKQEYCMPLLENS